VSGLKDKPSMAINEFLSEFSVILFIQKVLISLFIL